MSSIMGPDGYCPHCSQPSLRQYTFHGGHCPRVKAIEYHPNGGVKRIEFHGSQREPEQYIVMDGELRRLIDDAPPGAIPSTPDAGIFNLSGGLR